MRRVLDDSRSASEPVMTPSAYATRLAKSANVVCAYARNPTIVAMTDIENAGVLTDLAAAVNSGAGNELFPGSCHGDPGYRIYAGATNGRDTGIGFLVSSGAVGSGAPKVQVRSVSSPGAMERFVNADGSDEFLHEQTPLLMQASIMGKQRETSGLAVLAVRLSALDGELRAPGDHGWATREAYLRAKRRAQAMSLARIIQARQAAFPGEKLVVAATSNRASSATATRT